MISLTRHDAASAAQLLDSLTDIYQKAWAHTGDPFRSPEAFRDRYEGHARVPGFQLVTAHLANTLIGYIYGYPLPAGTKRWDHVLKPLADEFTREDGHRTIGINELHVLASHRRQGVARALHDEYIQLPKGAERVTLTVDPVNATALAVYRAWGYSKVGRSKPFPDSPIFDVLLLDTRPH